MLEDLRHPQPTEVLVDTAPVFNALHSLVSVTDAPASPGIGDWALQTRQKLSDDEWEKHRIITQRLGIEPLSNIVTDAKDLASFEGYIQALEAKASKDFRDELLHWMVARPGLRLNYKPLVEVDDPKTLVKSWEDFVAFHEHPDRDEEKTALLRKTFDLIINPGALQAFITEYLGNFWRVHLLKEWKNNLPELEEALVGFKQIDVTGMSHFEVIEAITRRNFRGVFRPEVLQGYETLRFIPSMHCGPYVLKTSDGKELRITFGAHHLSDLVRGTETFSSAHVVEQIRALADETRLEIIRLLKADDELGTQEIIDRLSLSKSTASRHLRQLVATGIVDVRVDADGLSKSYRLNPTKSSQMQKIMERLLG